MLINGLTSNQSQTSTFVGFCCCIYQLNNILEVKQLTLMHVRSAGIFVTNRNTLMTSQHVINKNNF